MTLALPPAKRLAEMVSTVTSTMLGISFVPAGGRETDTNGWLSAALPIPGEVPVTVGIASDASGCERLSSAMFSVDKDDLDEQMIEDSLRELVNMTAGLVKSEMGLDQALGLPQVMGHSDTLTTFTRDEVHPLILKAESTGLVLWICEGLIENKGA